MIVANKFQTGFDQPLLCAMYVDRILSGVTAVQTLSRLNRTYRTPSGIQKTAAMTQVVDFVNEPEEIRKAFEPYFTDAFLETETDPNLVHDLAAKLDTAGIYTQAEIDQCAEAFVKDKGHNALAAAVDPGKKRFAERYQAALIDNAARATRRHSPSWTCSAKTSDRLCASTTSCRRSSTTAIRLSRRSRSICETSTE
jgi:type I restriction enzyme, R subunit